MADKKSTGQMQATLGLTGPDQQRYGSHCSGSLPVADVCHPGEHRLDWTGGCGRGSSRPCSFAWQRQFPMPKFPSCIPAPDQAITMPSRRFSPGRRRLSTRGSLNLSLAGARISTTGVYPGVMVGVTGIFVGYVVGFLYPNFISGREPWPGVHRPGSNHLLFWSRMDAQRGARLYCRKSGHLILCRSPHWFSLVCWRWVIA